MMDRVSLILTILGGVNWLLVGLFQFDLVAYICGGQAATISRIVYAVIGIAAFAAGAALTIVCVRRRKRRTDRTSAAEESEEIL